MSFACPAAPCACFRDLPDVEDCGQRGNIDGELYVPPVLHRLGDGRQQNDAGGPEGLDDASGQGAVARREEFHHHGVGDALETLDEDALHEAEADEDHEATNEVDGQPDQTLGVQAHQHHVLATQPEREREREDDGRSSLNSRPPAHLSESDPKMTPPTMTPQKYTVVTRGAMKARSQTRPHWKAQVVSAC